METLTKERLILIANQLPEDVEIGHITVYEDYVKVTPLGKESPFIFEDNTAIVVKTDGVKHRQRKNKEMERIC